MKNHWDKSATSNWRRKSYIFAGIFVAIGLVMLINTLAAVPTTSIEPENGSIKTPALYFADTTASAGKAVQFKAGKFYIVGQQIIGPDGKVFLPMGANGAMAPGYVFNWNGALNGHVTDVKNWGWNIVRATLVCTNANGMNDMTSFYNGLDSLIDEYTAQKVVVMIECHDYTGANPTDVSGIYAFLDRMATKYASNAYVWYNPVNEPFTDSNSTDVTNWLNIQNTLLSRIRAKAPNGIFVADIPGYGQGVDTFKGTNNVMQLGSNKCNVLYSWHDYGAVSSDYNIDNNQTTNTQAQIAMFDYIRTNKIPVIIGEFGDPLTLDEGTAGPPSWNRWGAYAAMDNAPQRGIGLVWWHATGDSGNWLTYSLMADRHQAPWSAALTGVGLSAGGQKFWNVSKNPPAQPAFTGNLSDSHCPGV